jgi:hypothetical protein
MILALSLLGISIACYSFSQSLNHGQFRWSKEGTGFWDVNSDKRKNTSKIPFARTFLSFLTDGYHLTQFLSHLILAIAFGLLFEVNVFNWNGHIQAMIVTWLLIKGVHFAAYNTSSKK